MLDHPTGDVLEKLLTQRSRPLWERFPGRYRALVVETSDPLDFFRIRVKIPEFHDSDLQPNQCPYAIPSFNLGGQRANNFTHPCIGDYVWVEFEKGMPYSIVWVGFASPTRRKHYAYPQISQPTPLSVDSTGQALGATKLVEDYDQQYLPRDGRPMSCGYQDRYGHLDLFSAVGFFPEEHKLAPPPPGFDAVQGVQFQQQNAPQINDPDRKYIARVTKYGSMLVLSDQGYVWKKDAFADNVPERSQVGEFFGSFEQDEKFEINRWLSLQRTLNEDDVHGDHRRSMLMTRYGSRIEMRDTGWAQQGPRQSTSRDGEYGPPRILSREMVNDFRWIKLRTKGGMLFQAYDKGFDPQNDNFIKRLNLDEVGAKSEQEDVYWAKKDARMMRMVTRYGYKIVLDDRGTSPTAADTQEVPRGNGILIKGRRTPSANASSLSVDTVPRGFFWEFNENDEANHTSWGSPLGQTIELNDRYQYLMISAALGGKWAAEWQGLKENEFIGKPTMLQNPENGTYHLKLDNANEYLRLKTRAGKGIAPFQVQNPSGVGPDGIAQGLEARDGALGNGPWVELVDSDHRGLWFTKTHGLGIWRAAQDKSIYQWLDDRRNKVVIYNNEQAGMIEIYAAGKINIISKDDINLNSSGDVNIRGNTIKMQSNGALLTIDSDVATNKDLKCVKVHGALNKSQPGGVRVVKVAVPQLPAFREPTDRGKTYNGPFEACPLDEIQHPT